jgi:TPR repeat protein
MPRRLICGISLPPATLSSIPIFDFAEVNEGLAKRETEQYYQCCGKSICQGCIYSFCAAGNMKCPYCNSDQSNKTVGELVGEVMKRVEVNDAASIGVLANFYQHGHNGLQQDHSKAMELYARAAELGWSKAHCYLAEVCDEGDMKKAKFHLEAAAMAGNEVARCIVGVMEHVAGNVERAVKHWTIAASAGDYEAMHNLRTGFENGLVSRESIDSILAAYNNSCAEMRSKARDAYIGFAMDHNLIEYDE